MVKPGWVFLQFISTSRVHLNDYAVHLNDDAVHLSDWGPSKPVTSPHPAVFARRARDGEAGRGLCVVRLDYYRPSDLFAVHLNDFSPSKPFISPWAFPARRARDGEAWKGLRVVHLIHLCPS